MDAKKTAKTKKISEPTAKISRTKKTSESVVEVKNYGRAIFVFAILIFILLLIFTGIFLWQNGTIRNTVQLLKFRDSYQVVFLINGQAYFGNISEISDKYIVMENPFSIKVQQAQADEGSQVGQSGVILLSIEDEFYQPEGYMLIEKSSVLFIEELKDSSQIIEIIKNY